MSTYVEFTPYPDVSSSGLWRENAFNAQFLCALGYTSGHNNMWVLFQQTIPAGSIIVSAHVNLKAYSTLSAETVNGKCYFVNNGSPSPPTSIAEGDALPLTTGVAWSSIPAWTSGARYETPDLASDLQAVVNRSDYTTGNNILFVAREVDSTHSPAAYRTAIGYYDGPNVAQLHVTYNAAPEFAMSGTVSRFGTGIDGVTITVSGVGTVNTSGGGTWTKNVPYNWTGTLTPTKSGETFTPTSLSHDTPTQANESGQNFVMDFFVTPEVNIAYTGRVPVYTYKTNINTINIGYTTYPPSRNYYNISTTGITFSPLTPVPSTSLVDIRRRLNINAIGERVSLKFQNVESIDLILNDVGYVLTELYRRKGAKMNAKGNRVSLKFQNNESSKEFELHYLRLFEEIYEHQQGMSMNVKGNHLSFKFQNNTASKEFELQYVKPGIEIYENQ